MGENKSIIEGVKLLYIWQKEHTEAARLNVFVLSRIQDQRYSWRYCSHKTGKLNVCKANAVMQKFKIEHILRAVQR